jgi:hypothetical protein
VSSPLRWPDAALEPGQILANPAPFSRSGGKSLGGIERAVRTDRGFWKIAFKGVLLRTAAQRRSWNAIRTTLGGMAGVIAVPVLSIDTAPWLAGTSDGWFPTTFSGGATFSDGTRWMTRGIVVNMATAAAIGDTSVTLTLVRGLTELAGVRFSYRHALYETGRVTLVDGDDWTVAVSPAIRAPIPAGAPMELDRPTCLVHLATDDAMDASVTAGLFDRADVAFTEAVDVWNDLAG